MVRTPNRSGRKPVRRTPPPRRPTAGRSSTPAQGLRIWVIAGVAVIGLLLVWRVGAAVFGAGEGDAPPAASGTSGGTATPPGGEASPAPPGSHTETFPTSVLGTRLELRVIALGDHPDRCTAESLRLGGDVRTVYHHLCRAEPGLDRYYFLVQLTNVTDARVTVELDRFSVVNTKGRSLEVLETIPPESNTARFFPPSVGIVTDGRLKRWVTVDGTDGSVPAKLTYEDGAESLTVRFQGEWA
jgi:hypothetical protein